MTGNTRVDLKVVLLGKEFVGKTALVERFLHDRFLTGSSYQSTIGAAYGAKVVTCGAVGSRRDLVLGVWDTAGSERYESMARIYYRGAGAAVICYDVTDSESMDRAKFWTRELLKYEERCRIYLCGCKRDVATAEPPLRQVGEAEVTEFARSVGARAVETSSRTGENVDALFHQIAEDFALAAAGTVSNGGGAAPAADCGGEAAQSFSLGPQASGGSRGRCYCLG